MPEPALIIPSRRAGQRVLTSVVSWMPTLAPALAIARPLLAGGL